MASNITNANIDADFPIAGQDNDSQGFRDNFSEIKTGLGTAATEITSLQTTTATSRTPSGPRMPERSRPTSRRISRASRKA